MPIFGRKKEEVKPIAEEIKLPTVEEIKAPAAEEVKTSVEFFKTPEQPVKEEGPKEIKQEVKGQEFAPLFIKLERYKQILDSLAELKTILAMIKNSLSAFNELEKLKSESLSIIANAIEKVDKKISALDSEFLRPPGYKEELPEAEEVEDIETTLTDLRNQVSQLKGELKTLA